MDYEKEKNITPVSGFVGISLTLLLAAAGIAIIVIEENVLDWGGEGLGFLLDAIGCLFLVTCFIPCLGLKLVGPNEALVLSLFGKYHGTIAKEGFYTVNPFCMAITPKRASVTRAKVPSPGSGKISLKLNSWDNGVQKVNDSLGNPLVLSAVVFWKVVNPTKAVLNVDDWEKFLSSQTDSVIRNVARLYPYDFSEDEKEALTLRSSSSEIADRMETELQAKMDIAGIRITEIRLNQIAYAPEIAAAMLQRQQASAIIDARKRIVEGAVSMVQMALDELKGKNIVDLDDERKAQMVSNLLVVLCGNKDAQPIVNSGSIY